MQNEYLDAANELLSGGHFYTAMVAYQKVLALDPTCAIAHKRLGEIYQRLGQFDEAIASCQQALVIEKDFAGAYLTLGNIYQAQGDLPGAIAQYEKAISCQPDSAIAYANLGSIYYQQGVLKQAILYYEKALVIDPQLASVHFMLGNVFFQEGKLTEARQFYRQAIQLTPNQSRFYYKLGLLYEKTEKIQEAIACYEKGLTLQPNDQAIYQALYICLYPTATETDILTTWQKWQSHIQQDINCLPALLQQLLQQVEPANLFQRVEAKESEKIASDNDHALQPETFNLPAHEEFVNSVHFREPGENIAEDLTASEQENWAIAQVKRESRPITKQAIAPIQQGKKLLEKRQFQQAIPYFQKALKIQPHHPDIYLMLGNCFYELQQYEQAIQVYQEALQVAPDSPEIHANLGSIFVNRKQFDQAVYYYQQALKINPKMSGVYWNLAKLYQTKGEVETSLEYWNQALELNPQLADADFNFRLANTCFKANKLELAIQSYRRAIKQRPDYAEAYANLGHTYSRQNERDEAIAYYEKALQIDPDIHDIYRSLANNYFLQANYPQAIKYYQASLKYYPDVADTYANLGASLSHLGRLEEAISCYYQAIEIKPDWPDIYCRIGHIIKHDQLLEAVKLFEKAISYDIRHIEAHQQLCDLLCHTTNLTKARQAADRYWENCQDIAPILSAAAYLFAYFQSGLREEALAKFLDLEKYCYAHIHTMSLMEVKLIYEVLIFSIPHLRDGLAENSNYYRLISQRYLQDLSKQLPPPIQANYHQQIAEISNRPLRIGFLSKHFRRHSVGWCSEGVIRSLANISPDVHIYITGPLKHDDITTRFTEMPLDIYWPRTYPNGFADPKEISQKILDDQIDVLVDLDGMTLPGNVYVVYSQPAPVVISWLGFDAPYISSDHYFLCDWFTHPAGYEEYYQEKLIRLSSGSVAVDGFASKQINRNGVRENLGIKPDQVVYLSVAPARKTNRDMVRSQIAILEQVPNSVIVRKGQGDPKVVQESYYRECEALGIDTQRVILLGLNQTEEEHRAIYQVADVLLDSYPYNGGTHNLEGLWSALPLITRSGDQYLSRMGYSFLKSVNLDVGIAWSWQEYTTLGVQYGLDNDFRYGIRQHLEKMKTPEYLAPLWNPAKLAQEMYGVFQGLLAKV